MGPEKGISGFPHYPLYVSLRSQSYPTSQATHIYTLSLSTVHTDIDTLKQITFRKIPPYAETPTKMQVFTRNRYVHRYQDIHRYEH